MSILFRLFILALVLIFPVNQIYANQLALKVDYFSLSQNIDLIDLNSNELKNANKKLNKELRQLKKRSKKINKISKRIKRNLPRLQKRMAKSLNKMNRDELIEISKKLKIESSLNTEELKNEILNIRIKKISNQSESIAKEIVDAGGYLPYLKRIKTSSKKIAKKASKKSRAIASENEACSSLYYAAGLVIIMAIVLLAMGLGALAWTLIGVSSGGLLILAIELCLVQR